MRDSLRKYVKDNISNSPRRAAAVLAVGIAMAGAAVFVRQRTRAVERANPPMGQFIEVDGVRLHYIERGQGQPLVLLHGNGTMVQDFDISGLIDLASEQYRVIAFDRPGFGYSERPRTRIWSPEAQAADSDQHAPCTPNTDERFMLTVEFITLMMCPLPSAWVRFV